MAGRRRPSATIVISVLLHIGAVVALLVQPHLWPWIVAIIVADHLLLTAAGLWPRSKLLGPNWTHLPHRAAQAGQIAITIDDGPDPDITPRVLDLLDQHCARATFFCVGALVARHPALAQ